MLGRSTRTPDDRSVTPQDARRCRPTQKAHSCDRHHIASAMAELIFCLSIIPHVRAFDVPPKLSPAQREAFFAPVASENSVHLTRRHGRIRT